MYKASAVALFVVLTVSLSAIGQDDAKQVIEGRVLDASGAPLAGATVDLYEVEVSGYAFTGRRLEAATTGEDGAWSFSAALPELTPTRQIIRTVIASKPGLAIDWVMLFGGREGGDLVLGEPGRMAGKIVDVDGKGVSGAHVTALLQKGELREQQIAFGICGSEELNRTTDAEGRFEFANLPAGAAGAFIVTANAMAKACNLEASAGGLTCKVGDTDIVITLQREAVVEGRVFDSKTGNSIGGVTLILAPAGRVRNPFTMVTVASADDGSFRAAGLKPGATTVRLMPAVEGIADWVGAPVDVETSPGETASGVEFPLSAGGLVEIAVSDATTGAPVSGAGVSVASSAGDYAGARTGGDGKGVVRLLPGRYTIAGVSAEGYIPDQPSEAIEVRERETVRIAVALTANQQVSGRVVDADGKPVEGASVLIIPEGRRPGASTDAEGVFHTFLQPGRIGYQPRTNYIIVRHEKRNLAAAVRMGDEPEQVVTLQPAAVLKGRVVAPDDKGIAGASVTAAFSPEEESWGVTIGDAAHTDAEGRWEIQAVPRESSYRLTAQAQGHGIADSSAFVPTGDSVEEVDDLVLAVADKSVSGTVVDEDGKAVEGARVTSSGRGQPRVSVTTDSSGKFALDGVVEGPVYLSVFVPGNRAFGNVQAKAGDTDVKVVVRQSSPPPAQATARPQPQPLAGKPLPDLKSIAPEFAAAAEGKAVIVLFFDADQRPSRHAATILAEKAEALAAGAGGADKAAALAVDCSGASAADLEGWRSEYAAALTCIPIGADADGTRLAWGVKALPWLILADKDHVVRAEGFSVDELDGKLAKILGK